MRVKEVASDVFRTLGQTPNSYFERMSPSGTTDALGYYWPILGTGRGGVNRGDSSDDDLSADDSNWPKGTGYKWLEVCMSVGINGNPVRATAIGLVDAKKEADTGGDDCPGVGGGG